LAEEDRARRIAELRREIAEEEREIRRIYRLRSETRAERDAALRSYRRRISELASERDVAFTRIRELVRERERTPRRLEERRHELAEKISALAERWSEARGSIPALRASATRRWREAELELARLWRSLRWHRGHLEKLKKELEDLLKAVWNLVEYTKYYEYPGKRPINVELRGEFTISREKKPEEFWDIIERKLDVAFAEKFNEILRSQCTISQVGAEVLEENVKFKPKARVWISWKGRRPKWRVKKEWYIDIDVEESELT
jgi:hypothetical protein